MALQFIANSNGWLSFNAATPSLFITAETDDFDSFTLKAWEEEGFKVKYIPFGKGGKSYVQTLHRLGGGISIGERYAIVGIKPFLFVIRLVIIAADGRINTSSGFSRDTNAFFSIQLLETLHPSASRPMPSLPLLPRGYAP